MIENNRKVNGKYVMELTVPEYETLLMLVRYNLNFGDYQDRMRIKNLYSSMYEYY